MTHTTGAPEPAAKLGGGNFWRAVAAIAAMVGAAGALIGGLAAAGVFDDASSTDVTTVQEPSTNPPSPAEDQESAQSELSTQPDRATAILEYQQAATGCNPIIDVTIGDRTFTPDELVFAARDVQVGMQDYSISGTVICSNGVGCSASGFGTIDVEEGHTFYVEWQEVAVGRCDLILQP